MNFLDFSLTDWLDYLENRHSEEIQMGLQRIKTVAASFDLLHFDAQIITVAGTNGKGSTVAALEAIYNAAGYSVASYTSPHLIDFNERIRINQRPISDENLCAIFTVIEQGRNSTHLTYFEMATLAALWYFKQFKLDVILLEVGLGGRLDATNIIDADLAVITTVDLDHQDYLGHTKEAIGYEKAGILRPNRPYIYADIDPPASIIQHATLLNTACYSLGVNYFFKTTEDKLQITLFSGEPLELPIPQINPKAAAAAIIASDCLQARLPVPATAWEAAMREVHILGRQQVVLDCNVSTIFDVAHNPQAVKLLADFISRYHPKGKVYAVFSGLKDKDLRGLIQPMQSYVDFWFPAVLSSKRAASKQLILDVFSAERCFASSCFDHPLAAYQVAMERAEPGDLIVVYGSFLTVSAIMAATRTQQEELQ